MNKGFYDRQLRKLATPLDEARVQRREQDGKTLHFIEGWYAIAEANAIFGYDGWDREVVHFERLFERSRAEGTSCAYVARVRVSVRARTTTVVREGTGCGQASAPFAADAYDRALKAAETDATKRALATFGGRFGLMLYDKERRGQGAAQAARADLEETGGAVPTHGRLGPGEGQYRASARRQANSMAQEPATARPRGTAEGEAAKGGPFGYPLLASDGSPCAVSSAESFCSGLRQLIEAAASAEEIAHLRHNNEVAMAELRGVLELRSARGEHYADILERLMAKRAEAFAAYEARALIAKGTEGIPNGALTNPQPVDPPNAARPPTSTGETDAAPTTDTGLEDRAEDGADPLPNPGAKPVSCPPEAGLGRQGGGATTPLPTDSQGPSQLPAATDGSGPLVKTPCQYKAHLPVPPYPLRAVSARILAKPDNARAPAKDDGSGALVAPTPPRPRKEGSQGGAAVPTRRSHISGGFSVDKSALAIPSERRLRSKAHLVLVASKPCLICEGAPCHAHHVSFAQPRGLSLKVSDEYTVPLCVEHHNALHASGNEASWWRTQGIEPLIHAHKLWLVSVGLAPGSQGAIHGGAAKADPAHLPASNGKDGA